MLSKRKLLQLVKEKHRQRLGRPAHADDQRLPPHAATRPKAIRAFCKHIGVNKFNSTVEIGVLENFLREDLNKRAARVMARAAAAEGRHRRTIPKGRSRSWTR